MLEIFSKEFDLMCFVKDTKVMTDLCTLETASKKFGDKFLKHCIYEKKILFIDKKNGGLDWTDFGKHLMGL